jgi:hypothetical protein
MATHQKSDPFFAKMLGRQLLEQRQQTRKVFHPISKVPESISNNGELETITENAKYVRKTTI